MPPAWSVARLAPERRGAGLGQDGLVLHFGLALRLAEVAGRLGLRGEVRDVLVIVGVVDAEVAFGRLQPFLDGRVALQDDGHDPFGVRLETQHGIEGLLEAVEQHAADQQLVVHRRAEVANLLGGGLAVVVRAERDEASGDLHVELGRGLLEVVLHLRVDVLHQRLLMGLQDVEHFVFGLQVGLHVLHHLPGQLVEQLGVLVVVDVVEVHEPANQVVFEPLLWDHGVAAAQPETFVALQVLNQDFLGNGLEPDRLRVQVEILEAGCHASLGRDHDARDVDRQFVAEVHGLLDDRGDVHGLCHAGDHTLNGTNGLGDALDDLLEHLGFLEVRRTGQSLEFAENFQRGLGDFLLLGFGEERLLR